MSYDQMARHVGDVPPLLRTGMSSATGMAHDDRWHAQSARTDARAATRGDVVGPCASGVTRYPRYFSRAAGSYLWDLEGRRYVDFTLGYGPVVLGHADERVTEAVLAELSNGNCIAPLWSRRQSELTDLLVSVVPGAEMAYLLKTGSDATSTAVRLSRIVTGREKVLRWGYNGWHDWAAGIPAGIPEATRADTLLFDYSDLRTLREAFARHPGQVACVLMMPFGDETAPEGHLQKIRDIAHEHGALFVLDEMRSGFRLDLSGAQGLLGVQADVSTFSKAMANGHPISAVVGRADVLSALARTRISSTFYADPAPMAAALATIRILRDTDALERIWKGRRRLPGRPFGARRAASGAGPGSRIPADAVPSVHPPRSGPARAAERGLRRRGGAARGAAASQPPVVPVRRAHRRGHRVRAARLRPGAGRARRGARDAHRLINRRPSPRGTPRHRVGARARPSAVACW